MSAKFRVLLLVLLIATLICLVMQIRRKKLQLQYSMNWLGMLFILIIIAIFPGLLQWLSEISGVELPINLVFFLGFCFVLLIIYSLTSAVSRLSNENKELAQKIALLDEKLKKDGKE